MREGYGSCSVYVSVCLSVTVLAVTYLVYKSQVRCYKVSHCVDLAENASFSSFIVIYFQPLPS